MAESTPPFKLFFGDEDNTTNSFRLSREAPFSRFQELLGSLYPRYKAERDTLQYIGAGGGKVSFRNDEEYEEMLVVCRDRSLVKLYIEGRIDRSELAPVYPYGWWGHPWGYGYPYGHRYYGVPYWHDYHDWHWGGWGYNRKIYHALQNLWVGQSIRDLPYWLSPAVTLLDDDFDVNVNALVTALKSQTADCLRAKDTASLRQAKNLLATHVMIEANNAEVLYNLAKVEALLGNHYAAFTWLKKAANAGFNEYGRMKSDDDLSSLHAKYSDWDEALSAVRSNSNSGRKPAAQSSYSERIKFKPGQPSQDGDSKSSSSGSSSKPASAPAKKVEEEKPAPKPASGGFLFSLPGSQPEKPKEEPKPAPKPTGFLFALPGAAAPAEPAKPAEQPKPAEPAKQEQQPEPEVPAEVKKFQTQLDVLHGMGFLDDSLLVGFLEKFKGNVEQVLTELLG